MLRVDRHSPTNIDTGGHTDAGGVASTAQRGAARAVAEIDLVADDLAAKALKGRINQLRVR